MKLKKRFFTLWLVVFSLAFSVLSTSCTESSKKQKLIKDITDNLRTSYVGEIEFSIRYGEKSIDGTAVLSRDMAVTRLDIMSPEPYSGLSVEYDVTGVPSSVEVHFAGIDTTVPSEALAKINVLASIVCDDFLTVMSRTGAESITEYEVSENVKGYCAKAVFGEAMAELCFSSDASTPYSLHFSTDKISADMVFTKFKLDIKTTDE